jgi:lipoate-protein ligase B
MPGAGLDGSVQVLDVGVMEYGACLDLQRRLHDERARGVGEDTLILVEHPPVATLGRRGTPEEVFDASLPVHVVERGGKATYHGPGQLVLYPIMHLGEGNRDVRAWVQHLEALVVRCLADFGIAAQARSDQIGVWTVDTGRKVASVGVAIQRWVSLHGVALNVTIDPKEFERIDPCGLGAAVMTSMRREGSTATMDDVRVWMHQHAAEHIRSFNAKPQLVP